MESFSRGYYRLDMGVQPYKDGPTIERGLYDFIDSRFYHSTNAPVTMRVGLDGGPMFAPSKESAIPRDVVGVPEAMLDASEVHPSDDNVNVLILKPEYAYIFNQAGKIGDSFADSHNISDTDLSEDDYKFFDLGDE